MQNQHLVSGHKHKDYILFRFLRIGYLFIYLYTGLHNNVDIRFSIIHKTGKNIHFSLEFREVLVYSIQAKSKYAEKSPKVLCSPILF